VLIWTKHVKAGASVSPYLSQIDKSPLLYEPTSAGELYSQTFTTNSRQCTRSVAEPGNGSV
jgi:hypothetical protein